MNNEIVLFEAKDGSFAMPVQVKAETVWLTQAQMAKLFDRSQSVVARHINNVFAEGEVDKNEAYAKIAYIAENITGATKIAIYNLDVIISVGYRVKSQRGVEFRRWATRVLKEYIVRGYALNRERLKQLGLAVDVMKRVSASLDTEQVLDVVKTYSSALDLSRRLRSPDYRQAQDKGTLGRTHRRPHACCADGHDCGVEACRKGNDGQPSHDFPCMR